MTRPIYRTLGIEGVIANFSEDCPHAQHMRVIATQLRNSVSAMGTLFERPNPTDTVAAQQKRVAIASKQLAEQARLADQKLQKYIGEAHGIVQARIDAKLNLKENQFAQEIRAAFRVMSNEMRIETLKSLAHANKGPEIAAIINSPAILTGISEDMQKQYKTYMMDTHAPAEMAEHQAIVEAYQTASSACRIASDTASDFANPTRLAEIEAREREAAQAEAAFNATANQPVL